MEVESVNKPAVIFLLPLLLGLVILSNHYIRDAVGALEKQLEEDVKLGLSIKGYANLNTVFFLPNIVMPLIGGALASTFRNASQILMYACVFATLGHLIFATGASINSLELLFTGRFFAGIVYEIIDTLPVAVLGPFFRENWGLIGGLLNAFLRLGSVLNFLLSPYIFGTFGIRTALWVAAGVGSLAMVCSLGAMLLERALNTWRDEGGLNCTSLQQEDLQIQQVSVQSDTEDVSLQVGVQPRSMDCSSSANFVLRTLSWVVHDALRLHEFSLQFYFYLAAGAFLYGSMVPFWFMGSKLLQERYRMSVYRADLLMLLPEGAIVFIAPAVGITLDQTGLIMRTKLRFLSGSCVLLALAYIGLSRGQNEERDLPYLLLSHQYPVLVMFIIGVAYAISNSLFWAILPFGVPQTRKDLLGIATGLTGSALNVLPACIPSLTTAVLTAPEKQLYVLSTLALMSAVFALIASSCDAVPSSEMAAAAFVFDTKPLAMQHLTAKNSSSSNNNNNKTSMAQVSKRRAYEALSGMETERDDDDEETTGEIYSKVS